MTPAADQRSLVAYARLRFDPDGVENGFVSRIKQLLRGAYRHFLVSLTQSGDFEKCTVRADLAAIAPAKAPAHLLWIDPRLC